MGDLFNVILFCLLAACALAISRVKDLLYAIILFSAYSLIMALIWLQMHSADVAITEAAVGVGMSVLMVTVVMKTQRKEDEP